MNLLLKNKIVLVTGGSKGIGADIVRILCKEGAKVVFCARPSLAMANLESELRSGGFDCKAMQVDVLHGQGIEELVNSASAYWGGLDILINNIGGAIEFGGFEELRDEDWLRSYELNVMTMVRFTRSALPHLRKSQLRRIINISSTSAVQPGYYNPHYSVTKAAVVNLSKHLANVLAKEQILVNIICPGPVHSDSWDKNLERVAIIRHLTFEEAKQEIDTEESAKIPLGFVGDGHYVGSLVAFLASPLSGWTTGSCFHINGGKLAGTS